MVFGGGFREPLKVAYFNAVLYNREHFPEPDTAIVSIFGQPLFKSPEFDFSHTEYYTPEMDRPQSKYFAGYGLIDSPERLAEFKIKAVELENSLMKDGRRFINVDPGYVALEKVVAASTKNFTHRIYIGGRIYADLQLQRRKNAYQPLPWTFQDYTFPQALELFEKVRNYLIAETSAAGLSE
ncbi:DUF4416 family protein [Geovibrio thiophilus]|uniref:DUF4416 family protein n=1 Tax=Geovibrio thiophilus TaxID=139438 RepID=A0A410JXP5_9BACT|nr:DUF4416 family protein [Geovibrio thiophilus]QAR32889.1 DUF4416 family protein [Geovibrio thiophilus]